MEISGDITVKLEVRKRWHHALWYWLGYGYVVLAALVDADLDTAANRAAWLYAKMGIKVVIRHGG